MSHFIIIFRRDGRAETVERIDDATDALDRLMELEKTVPATGKGVVMLRADSEATIRATHGQYFETLDELLEVAGS